MTNDHDDDTNLSRRDFTKALGAASIAATGVGASSTAAAAPTTQVGSGGYTTTIPGDASAPSSPEYATSNVSAPYPTNDWWSRLLTATHSETLFSHPIFTEPTGSGLEIGYTDEWKVGDGNGVDLASETDQNGNDLAPYVGMSDSVYMPFAPDFTIGHTATSEFDQSLVDGYGDWHVEYRMGSADPSMTVTQVQGSPYLYLDYRGGGAELTFDAAPTVFEDRGNALGITVDGHHYGLFAPAGTSWSGKESATLTNDLGSAGYVTVALLPDDTTATFDTVANYAHNHVTDTRIDWEYVETENGEVVSEVRTTFDFTVEDRSSSGSTGTIAALYPHQHKYLADGQSTMAGLSYESPRGTMKLSTGSSFTTALPYPGILPNYPIVEGVKDDRLGTYANSMGLPDPNYNEDFDGSLAEKYDIPTASEVRNYGTRLAFIDGKEAPFGGTYWSGLNFNRWSEAAALLDQGDWTGRRDCVLDVMKGSFEQWFTPEGDLGAAPDALDDNHFFYDGEWGTMVGHIGGFNSYSELNDHHFHYGYYVKGASEVARHDPTWAQADNWGGMVRLLIQEYANPSRDDDMFPFLRNFSPYTGHSFASGVNPFHLGNNQEASSEAVNAYAGLIRWGAFTGQEIDGTSIHDLGVFLYTHEIHAALEYWYDWDQENHPDDWDREYASVTWGDGYSHSTWWTEDNEDAYAINVIPANGDSLYLGWDEDHTQTVYDELVSLKGNDDFVKWKGILLEFGAFADPANALSIFNDWEGGNGNFPGNSSGYYVPDMSNSKLHTYTMLGALDEFGSPTRSVVSDTTFSHVLVDDSGQKNYLVYNHEDSPTTVRFSDGTQFEVAADTLAVQRGATDGGGSGGDTTPPSAPSNLTAGQTTPSTIDLSWDASTDDTGVANYVVTVDGEQVGTPTGTSFTVEGLAADTSYELGVAAVDAAGNGSPTTTTTASTAAGSTESLLSVAFPNGNNTIAQGTVEAELSLSAAPGGLAGFDVSVTVADTAVATITDASVDDAFPDKFRAVSVADDGSSVTLEGVDADSAIESGATDVTLGTITLSPQSPGETAVGMKIDQIDADGGSLVEPTTEAGTLAVSEVLDAVGDNPAPTDPDGDGLYEDVNGNGRLDSEDVVVLFNNREDSAVTDQVEHFDFNDNGRIDFDDITELFEEL